MQTTKQFSDEIINFPAAGFAVASFVTPNEPQPPSTTSPLFTPEPNAPTPSALSDGILDDENFFQNHLLHQVQLPFQKMIFLKIIY